MQYDLPHVQLEATAAHNVERRPARRRGRALTAFCWVLATLTLSIGALTVLRYMGMLEGVIETLRGWLHTLITETFV